MNLLTQTTLYKTILGLLVLVLSACSQFTTLRTTEIKSVESNLGLKIDSLELKIDSMRANQQSFQRRIQADLGSLVGVQENGINRMVSLLEEMGYTVDKVAVSTNQIKNNRVKVIHELRGSDSSSQASTKITSLAGIEVEKLFATAQQDFSASRFKEAYKQFNNIYKLDPKGRRAEDALYWMAVCYERTEKHDWAATVFDRLIKEFPEGSKMCTTQFHLSRIAAQKKDVASQKKHLQTIIEHPKCGGTNEQQRASDELKALK